MLIHHLKTAVRAFLARKLHTLVNVFGLALGFSSFLGAYVFVHYGENADQHFPNADRIHVVFQRVHAEHFPLPMLATARSSSRLAERLRVDLPELEAVARLKLSVFMESGAIVVATREGRSFRRVQYTQPPFLDIFRLNYLYGSAETVTEHVRSAILTEQATLAMFGTANAIGESIELPDGQPIEVAGVISAIREPSHLGVSFNTQGFEVLVVSALPEDTAGPSREHLEEAAHWASQDTYTYVLLPRDGRMTLESLNEYLAELGPRVTEGSDRRVEYDARPVSHIASSYGFPSFPLPRIIAPVSPAELVLLLGLTILAIAGVNFLNLATVTVAARTREMAVRQVVGASRIQVVLQYLLEAMLTAAIAVSLGIVVVELALPAANIVAQKDFSIPWSSEFGWLVVGAVVVCGLVVGIYPAMLLSRIRPTQALRMIAPGTGSRMLRTLLITAQFAAASFLAIMMLVVQKQNSVLQEAGLRFDEDPYVVIENTPNEVGLDAEVLRSELLRSPNILEVTGARPLPWETTDTVTIYSRSPDPAVETVFTQLRSVTFDFFRVLGLELLAGTQFTAQQQTGWDSDPDLSERPRLVVLDQTAAQRFGWPNVADAVGQSLYTPIMGGPELRAPVEIIGVVRRPPFEFRRATAGSVYSLSAGNAAYPIVRIDRDGVGPALAHIDAVWSTLAPQAPIRRDFLEARFRQLYRSYEIRNFVFVALAGLGLGVAAMGLFGIAAFVAARRRQEVGIRKTLGATTSQVALSLVRDFCKPVIVANLLAWPLAFVAATSYLDAFSQRAELGPSPFLTSLGLTVLVALVAVASQVVTAARTQPARVLRYE